MCIPSLCIYGLEKLTFENVGHCIEARVSFFHVNYGKFRVLPFFMVEILHYGSEFNASCNTRNENSRAWAINNWLPNIAGGDGEFLQCKSTTVEEFSQLVALSKLSSEQDGASALQW